VGIVIANLRRPQDCAAKLDRFPLAEFGTRAFSAHCAGIGIMLPLRLAMIQTEPAITRKTINTPNAG
jgi:hypothetical protein